MSIIIAESWGDTGIVLADTLITRPSGPSHLTFDLANHNLKVHPIKGHLCIGVAGAAYNLGIEVIQQIKEKYAGDAVEDIDWGETVAQAQREHFAPNSITTEHADFVIIWNAGNGLSVSVVRSGVAVKTADGNGYIGDSSFYSAYQEERLRTSTESYKKYGLPAAIIERVKSESAFQAVVLRRSHSTVGTMSNFGCNLHYEANRGFTFPVAAELSVDPSSGKHGHCTYLSNSGPRVIAYYYSQLAKGFVFLPGQSHPRVYQGSTGKAFAAAVKEDLGIEVIGSEWENSDSSPI